MKKKSEWIDNSLLRVFEAESTNAHRLCTSDKGWVERFGHDILISYKDDAHREELIGEFHLWNKSADFEFGRIFGRLLPKQNEERTSPRLLSGDSEGNFQTTVIERKLKFGIDFSAGYSVGLFLDQRENRSYVHDVAPKRLLNCFAYTCSFSVAGASAGAQTVNADLSKKSLDRGRENFALNNLPINEHRFIVDDVRPVLRRLARRGENFDTIILDPPTFSRARSGKAFHVDKDFEDLLSAALEIANRKARILLSTNCETLHEHSLEVMARYCLKVSRRAGTLHRQRQPIDYPPGTGASTMWLTLH